MHRLIIRYFSAAAGLLWFGSIVAAPPAQLADSLSREQSDSYTEGYRAGYDDGFKAGYRAAQTFAKDSSTQWTARSEAASMSQNKAQESRASRYLHSLGAEFRPEYIFPTNPFLKGANAAARPINRSLSGHLRYSFRYRPGSSADRIYGGAYQGVGIAWYDFGNTRELGSPVAVYLFQGARIARLAPRLSLDYEWNLGLSFGWKPYDELHNPENVMTGSRLNALVNIDLLLNWQLHRSVHLTAGIALTHFSNGNTKFPNAGLNSLGLRAGVTYDFNSRVKKELREEICPAFPRHVSYDLTLFGSWRRRGIEIDGGQYAVADAFPVVGISFAPMYNFGYKFRAGVSLDGVYDGSTNVVLADQIVGVGDSPEIIVEKPGFDRQIALGLSARAEFVMPHFSVGIGLGGNVLHKGGELKAFYQMLTLKLAMTHSSYLHIGYSLRDFHLPNFLMLGVGYRFNNRTPRQR